MFRIRVLLRTTFVLRSVSSSVPHTVSCVRSRNSTFHSEPLRRGKDLGQECRVGVTRVACGSAERRYRGKKLRALSDDGLDSPPREKSDKTILTLPTILTLGRVVAIPLLAVGYYIGQSWSPLACSLLFIAASLTDWLDGFLARKMGSSSSFGAFLDPVADKLMVATALILLSSSPVPGGHLVGNQWIIPMLSLIIIGREITMSSLREWAATTSKEAYKAVAVSSWGKLKTASQMISIVLLFLSSDPSISYAGFMTDSGICLLSCAAYLSLWSLILYFKNVWKYL